ncbi:MAG: glutamate synthase large subunit [Spirochaetales bacterium]|nr:glutamate synthase large subunit [Spirochaetales bacterium]
MRNYYSVKKEGLYDPLNEHEACGVGFVADIKGKRSHSIIEEGMEILKNLEHRGAVGGDAKTGDGAGMLVQMPHKFLKKTVSFDLPDEGSYGAGIVFLPRDEKKLAKSLKLIEDEVKSFGAKLLGIRDLPIAPDCLGELALNVMPSFRQVFVSVGKISGDELEVKLYMLRKIMEKKAADAGFSIDEFYFSSFSCKTMIYKGMFVAPQFRVFYPDLADKDFESAIALVHQRYSTNTFPSWPLAQPFRYIAHNGEINTLKRNVNNMTARETTLGSERFGDNLDKMYPIVLAGGSDSAAFDNVFELLNMGGRDIEHSMMMMVPEAFGSGFHMSEDRRLFYEYHASIMEPWDGPAAIAFTDGVRIGATLDRNGLRPGRYTITRSGKIVMASEAGVIDIPVEDILQNGRLAPGKMILIDTSTGRVKKDNEIKSIITRKHPYRRWLEENKIELSGLLGLPGPVDIDADTLYSRFRLFGYTFEDLKLIIASMANNAQEPIGSMGNDTPPAVLSQKAPLLYDYFRQLFAQVTNPPIDPYRENLVMSLMSFVGRERNLLDQSPEHCRQLKLAHPVLTNDDIIKLKKSDIKGFAVDSVDMVFEVKDEKNLLESALDDFCKAVEAKIDNGASLIILSDRNVDSTNAPIPALLAVSAAHNYLVSVGKRHLAALVVESGEVREVQHFATLISFGASGVNPYLVFESISDLQKKGYIGEDVTEEQAILHYINAVKKGLLKIMSKMGISTIRSYRGSKIFEIVGLGKDLVEKYFTGATSRIGGIGLDVIQDEILARHKKAFFNIDVTKDTAESSGVYSFRKEGEKHLFSPNAVVLLQKAVRTGDFKTFCQYSDEINDISRGYSTFRSLFKIKTGNAIPIEEVESENEIVKRFVSSAMSLGSLSQEAHETMAIAMNRLGGMSNSGEGGEGEERYTPLANGDSKKSKVKQVASGRFGVDGPYLVNCEELQIKIAQGAKPGEGGQLPGHKVNEMIAKVRHSTPGVMLISPPPHHDIYSIEDLSQLIFDLKNANKDARVSVKLVSELGVGTVAAGVAKGKADMVLISGSDGGTGASPLSSIRHAGSYWEIGLAETQQTLIKNKLRKNIRVQVDGQLKTGRDVVIGALLGAEEFGFGSCSLVSIGCVMMRKCHANNCPVGVATQDPELRKRFPGKPEHLMNFMLFIARQVREYMAQMGFRKFEEMVGRVDMLDVDKAVDFYKAQGLDFSDVLYTTPEILKGDLTCKQPQDHDFSLSLDPSLIEELTPAIESQSKATAKRTIRNCNRTVGAMLSSEVFKRYGSKALPDDTLTVEFKGIAGQSFGAFLAKGITFKIEGATNDYLGKGLSGGKIILYPEAGYKFLPEKNIITGNVNLFGATGGVAYINGCAGERFAVRNSGATAVVEGIGDHGCEYMTGGRVIVLGRTGVNFAAGMSGGIAYVYDADQLFDTKCNHDMVDLEAVVEAADLEFLQTMIENHYNYTGSPLAKRLLDSWEESISMFVKVMPIDYRKALERISESESKNSDSNAVTEEVYS